MADRQSLRFRLPDEFVPNSSSATLHGLLIDFGGVLTSNVFDSFGDFCRAEGLKPEAIREQFLTDTGARELLEQLEIGQITEAQFEPPFAKLLGVRSHEGLIDRMFAGMRPEPVMIEAVAAAKRAGVRTGLLSNSWGEDRYDRSRFGELFDTLVISGEVGLRKPDPAIYVLACERLERRPERCVLVDDLPGNLKPALALGMATVLHRDASSTLDELEPLLGVSLR
jgi:epoxide hydrolase-like predicted phosphatase